MSTSISERFFRADQALRLARARAVLEHRGEGSDLIVGAMADIEVEDLIAERLEALIAYEAERDAQAAIVADAHGAILDRLPRMSS